MIQLAANMVRKLQKISTKCEPLDEILDGGLSGGQILEISGPPGSPKERMAVNILRSFVEVGEEVIFVGKSAQYVCYILLLMPSSQIVKI